MPEKTEVVTKVRNPLHYLCGRGPAKKTRQMKPCMVEGKPAVRIPVGLKAWALVDPEDASEVYAYRWTPSGNYAKRRSKRPQFMHRLVADMAGMLRDGLDIDHKNGDGMDNRRCNLRSATRAENIRNSSRHTGRFKGIAFENGKWVAKIRAGGRKPIYLGRFTDEVEAALAYDRAARELHGEFARLNFPEHSAI